MLTILVLLSALSSVTPNPAYLHHYKASVVRAYDGDTATFDIDLGLHVKATGVKVRLYGIDAPELRGPSRPEGLKSRDVFRSMIYDHEIIIETVKDKTGKYGRLLGIIWVLGKGEWCLKDTWCNANDYLVATHNAVYRKY